MKDFSKVVAPLLAKTPGVGGFLRKKQGVLSSAHCGGAEETRTPDFLRAREALSQLSYSPVC